MQWYLNVLENYGNFEGRARRKEYWMFALINAITILVLGLLGQASKVIEVILFIYDLALIIPNLAVTARRLHDTGRSGWWQLISMIPLVGSIILIVFLCQDSGNGPNRFGPSPKLKEVA